MGERIIFVAVFVLLWGAIAMLFRLDGSACAAFRGWPSLARRYRAKTRPHGVRLLWRSAYFGRGDDASVTFFAAPEGLFVQRRLAHWLTFGAFPTILIPWTEIRDLGHRGFESPFVRCEEPLLGVPSRNSDWVAFAIGDPIITLLRVPEPVFIMIRQFLKVHHPSPKALPPLPDDTGRFRDSDRRWIIGGVVAAGSIALLLMVILIRSS